MKRSKKSGAKLPEDTKERGCIVNIIPSGSCDCYDPCDPSDTCQPSNPYNSTSDDCHALRKFGIKEALEIISKQCDHPCNPCDLCPPGPTGATGPAGAAGGVLMANKDYMQYLVSIEEKN
ncbi:MAG: hypothetical protein K0Q87_5426 [Neobacillus sp.]|nr:hypothetical protein [Neobacillus sp.]